MSKSRTSRRPGKRAGLTTDAVISAAMAAYSREGISALSIRSVASELGVAPNAIYSHVKSKGALIDEVIDRIIGETEAPSFDMEWRRALRLLMIRSRAVLLQHPTLMPEFLARPARGPNALRLGEATLRFLEKGGVVGPAAVSALRVLLVYTIGFAAQESPRATDPDGEGRHEDSIRAFSSDSQRLLSRAAAEQLAQHPGDAVFETGLDWLLNGIADDAHRKNEST